MRKLLFIVRTPFYPDVSGGSELSTLHLLQSLHQMGWHIEVICTRDLCLPRTRRWCSPYFWKSWWYSLMRLHILFPVSIDQDLGYPCWRVINTKFTNEHNWLKFFNQRLREYQPDVVLSQRSITYPILKYAASQSYPTMCFVRDMDGFEPGHYAIIPDGVRLIANSPFAASIVTQVTNHVPEVILPFMEIDRYRVSNRQRKYITFINPVPQKGANIAIEIARQLPQEKFLFVKGKWPGYSDVQKSFLELVNQLPNVEIWEHQQDMRYVYAVTDILLVPSQFQETFGRVIVEAQVNSIPVVAANVAGIPYTLGNGGVLVEPPDKPQAYVDALRRLRYEDNFYPQLSKLAFQNSQRLDFDAQYQVRRFVQLVENCIQDKQALIRAKNNYQLYQIV